MEFPGEKLVIKLWETLAEKGIGSLLTPWQTIREGRARNEVRHQELLMLAQAEKDAADVRAGRKQLRSDGTLMLTSVDQSSTDITIESRIEPTLGLPNALNAAVTCSAVNAARIELNSAKAVIYAEEQLANDPQTPPDREIDEDWLFAWRDYAGKVSAEDLQRLWGSVLAGEIKSPGRYSIRTLEFLKTLSKPEADVISKIARYAIDGRIARGQKQYLDERGLTFGLLLRLQEMGVVSGVEAVGLNTSYKTVVEGKFIKALLSNGKALIVEHDDPTKVLKLEVYLLTEVGSQILGLGSFEPDLDYLRLVGKQIVSQGFTVQLCDWLQVSEYEGRYFNEERIDA
ncbi:DUF2806 domain-containing protein [Aeromonas sp. 600886]|uniref:DUF2806 domain-containing protein n=1 Tax=Aeromonas sp. 600886 TaxID=2712033 RepID=UPI003B9F1B03